MINMFKYSYVVIILVVNLIGIAGQFIVDFGWDGTIDNVNFGSIMLCIMFSFFFVYWFIIRNAQRVVS